LSSFGLAAEIDYDIRGYFYFLITAAMMHLVAFWVIVLMHAYENVQRNR
jgi:hypothetical protein